MSRSFYPAGDILHAEFGQPPEYLSMKKRQTGARAMGLRYEKKVQEILQRTYKDQYSAGRWIKFISQGDKSPRWCQPDGFILDIQKLKILLIEIKLKHCNLAWRQLSELYAPVLLKALPFDTSNYSLSTCEITHWYDPSTQTEVPAVLRRSLDQVRSGEFAVHILNPKRVLCLK